MKLWALHREREGEGEGCCGIVFALKGVMFVAIIIDPKTCVCVFWLCYETHGGRARRDSYRSQRVIGGEGIAAACYLSGVSIGKWRTCKCRSEISQRERKVLALLSNILFGALFPYVGFLYSYVLMLKRSPLFLEPREYHACLRRSANSKKGGKITTTRVQSLHAIKDIESNG